MAVKPESLDTSSTPKRSLGVYAAVAGMLAWYFALSLSAAATKSVTFDETLHLTGGYSYWKFGDFRLHAENGNLPQRWAAIPLFFGNTHFPVLTPEEWRMPDMFAIGDAFIFGSGNGGDSILMRGRAMIGLLGVALGLLIFLWARSLLGTGPAFVSLGLYAFCPTVLTQGGLATSDMATTLFFTASVLCIWRALHVVNWQNVLIGSLVMGALFVSKFSAVVVLPMGVLLMAVQLISREPTQISFRRKTWNIERRHLRLVVHLMTFAVQAIGVLIVIWGFYNFRYEMFATTETPEIFWNDLLVNSGVMRPFIVFMRDWRLLPQGFLFGFANVLHYADNRPCFLNGDYGLHGFSLFFPYCVLVKTPLTLFVLIGLAATWIIETWYATGDPRKAMYCSLYRSAPLWVLFAVYWMIAITSRLNIGHRHILPTYPPMLIFAGCSWWWVTQRRSAPAADSAISPANRDRRNNSVRNWLAARRHPLLACAVLASMVSFATESLSNWPNYLAYFNPCIGSHLNAYRHLVDSSLDWGQDLPALKQWLSAAGFNDSQNEKPYLSYFGTGNPDYYGINATLLPGFWDRNPPRIPAPLKAGAYCISATMLQSLYMNFPGRWNRVYEDTYQQLAEKVRQFNSSSPEKRKQLIAADGQTVWATWFRMYEQARFARLSSFLRTREPDSEINYSILIYWLSESDLDRAINGPPIELLESSDFSGRSIRRTETPGQSPDQ